MTWLGGANADAEHYNYFRDYDPAIGRYLRSDPIGLKGGYNTYGYVFASPLRLSDLLGLEVRWHGTMFSGGATLGFGGQLSFYTLTSECKCNRQVKLRGFASFVTIGAGANLKGVGEFFKDLSGSGGSLEMTDSVADCPDPSAPNGPAWTSGVNAVMGAGGNLLSRLVLGRLKMYSFADGPAYGFDMSVTSTFWGQSAVTSAEITECKRGGCPGK
jgi:RHS repeat-associated protein